MKKIILVFIATVVSLGVNAQTYKMYQTKNYHNQLQLNTKTGKVVQIQDDGFSWTVCEEITPLGAKEGRYRLIPTENYWTFILLDSFTGKLWQCQFSVEGTEYIFTIPLNRDVLANYDKPVFEVSPMTSMYQFYLTDSTNGNLWQFQWSNDSNPLHRWIQRIR